MTRTRDYSQLRDTENLVKEELKNKIESQSVEDSTPVRPIHNPYAQKVLSNMDPSLVGMNQLGNDMVRAHNLEREHRIHGSSLPEERSSSRDQNNQIFDKEQNTKIIDER